mgnify:CR=1 FL=1
MLTKTADLILVLRKEKGLTQQELGDILGVSSKSISKYERGICLPSDEVLLKMTSFFNISFEELLNGKRNKPNKNFKVFIFFVILITIFTFFLTKLSNRQVLFKLNSSDLNVEVKGDIYLNKNSIMLNILNINYSGDDIKYDKLESFLYINNQFIKKELSNSLSLKTYLNNYQVYYQTNNFYFLTNDNKIKLVLNYYINNKLFTKDFVFYLK